MRKICGLPLFKQPFPSFLYKWSSAWDFNLWEVRVIGMRMLMVMLPCWLLTVTGAAVLAEEEPRAARALEAACGVLTYMRTPSVPCRALVHVCNTRHVHFAQGRFRIMAPSGETGTGQRALSRF